jgi:hypothetical protein
MALVRIDVSEKRITYNIRVTRISELGTALAVTRNRSTWMMEAIRSSETSVLKRATRCNIPDDGILQLLHTIYFETERGRDKTVEVINKECRLLGYYAVWIL